MCYNNYKKRKEEKVTALKGFRESLSLTQEDVARLSNLTLKAYWSIESGKSEPKLTNLTKISSALNITVEDLVKLLTS